MFETLEARKLMSASWTDHVELRRGELTVTGTRGNDEIYVEELDGTVQVGVLTNGRVLVNRSFANVVRVRVLAGKGDDNASVSVSTVAAKVDAGTGNDSVHLYDARSAAPADAAPAAEPVAKKVPQKVGHLWKLVGGWLHPNARPAREPSAVYGNDGDDVIDVQAGDGVVVAGGRGQDAILKPYDDVKLFVLGSNELGA